MAKVKITLVRSPISRPADQRATVKAGSASASSECDSRPDAGHTGCNR